MAKLSAHGTEIARLMRKDDCTSDQLVSESKKFVSIRSDGSILAKRTVKFRPDVFNPDGRSHDYGWKLASRKTKLSSDAIIKAYVDRGYTIEK